MPNTPVEVKKSAAPTDVFQSLRSEMDKLFERFAGSVTLPTLRGFFSGAPTVTTLGFGVAAPAVDVIEDDKVYSMTVELPGLEEKDVDITVSGNTLLLKGEKREESESKGKNYYLSERSYGSFQRAFPLPNGVDQDAISAKFGKGVLTITLPKTADAQKQQKKIEIKAA